MRTLLPALMSLLLWACTPMPGRQSSLTSLSVPPPAPPAPVRRKRARTQPRHRPHSHTAALRGEDIALVRPYLIAHERRRETLLQRERRTALVLASMGIDYSCVDAA